MKRFSKILVALLALCLLVGALALAISANNSAPSGKYVVLGEGYNDWESAVGAAANTHTIYLNEEISLDATVDITGADTKVKVNLNGKSITATTDATLFNVTEGASFTLEGAGTINAGLATVVSASGQNTTVTVDGTGSGIVVNHNEDAAESATAVTAFNVSNNGILNVFGKLTVGANNGTRKALLVKGAAQLNITNANISLPLATGDSNVGHSFVIVLTDNIDVNISGSKINAACGTIFNVDGAASGAVDISSHLDGDNFTYKDTAASGIELAAATIDIDADNSTFTAGCSCSSATFIRMGNAKVDAHFDKCLIYTQNNASVGSVSVGVSTAGTKVVSSQLYFTDCDFMAASTAQNYFFYDGANYKIIGGSFNNGAFARGSFNYLPLTDEEGNPTGQWIGGYIDNILLPAAKTFATTGRYADLTATAADSRVKGTAKRIIDGNEYTFNSGYFSDSNLYGSYIYGVEDNIKVNQNGNANGNAVSSIALNAGAKTTVAAADDPAGKGNGYIKTTITDAVNSASHVYSRITTPATQLADSELIVTEFDVMSDSRFPTFYIPLRVRSTKPKFDVNGKYIGSEGNVDDGSGTFQIYYYDATRDRMKFGSGTIWTLTYNHWYRITLVYDIVKTETTVDVNPWVNGAKDTSQTITMPAYDISKSKIHAYVDGTYLGSADFGAGLGHADNGKIIAKDLTGAATDSCYMYYFNSYFYKGKSAGSSIAFDNYRYSAYSDAYVSGGYDSYDFGLYQADGTTPVTSIKNNEHFLVMPDNNTTDFTAPAPTEPTYVAKVDGVGYETEEAAIAAIQSGSTLELLQNFNNNIEKNCAYTVVTNGFTVPGFISEDYKVVDYTGANGTIVLTEAAENEKFGIKYSFGTKEVTEYAALGTLFTATEESFPGSNGPDYTIQTVTSWNAPTGVASGLSSALLTNAIPAETGSVDAYYETGSIYYASLADAMAAANGETVKLLRNLNVSALDNVTGSTAVGQSKASAATAPVGFNISSDLKLDLNGKTIEQGFDGILFNVTDAKLELIGEATVNGAGTLASVSGANAKLTVMAYGKGLTLNTTATLYSTFVISGGASSYVFGNVDINLANGGTTAFYIKGAKNVDFDRANVVIGETDARTGYNTFFEYDYNNITISNSYLEAVAGSMFRYTGTSRVIDIATYLYKDETAQWLYVHDDNLVDGKANFSLPNPETTITATGSTIIAAPSTDFDPVAAEEMLLFIGSYPRLKADFTNCEIVGNNRTMSFGGRPSQTMTSLAPAQLTFTDCNYRARGANKSGGLFYQNCNVKWKGGSIIWNGNLVDCAFAPFECQNGFVGVWFEDVHVRMNSTTADWKGTTPATGTGFNRYFYNKNCTVDSTGGVIIDGELVNIGNNVYWTTSDVVNPFVDVRFASTWNSSDASFSSVTESVDGLNFVYTESGKNGYLKLSLDSEYKFNDEYFDIRLSDSPSKDLEASYPDGFVPTAMDMSIANSRFMVQEFDISTDNMLPEGLALGMQTRSHYAKSYGLDGSDNVIITEAVFQYAGINNGRIVINPDGSCQVFDADAAIDVTPGVWNRFTIVYEFVKTETTMTVTTEGGDSVEVPAYDFWGSKAHAYINGEYVTSFNLFTDDDSAASSRYVEKTTAQTYTIVGLRAANIENDEGKESSIGLDNVVAAAYNVDPGIYNGDTLKTTITKTDKIYTQPFAGHGIIVDGHAYRTLEETQVAIKDGSIVELTNNYTTPVAVNAKDITLITNGYSFAGFVSEDKKVIDYSASGYLYTETADADEIFEITYDYDEKQASQTAALGTVLSAPAIFDSYKTPVRVDSEWSFLKGWTLVDGEEVYVVTADGVAYPVIETVASVIITWLDENYEVLDTDYYFPGANKVLDEYDGPAIADTATEKYYSVGFIGWDGIEAATEALATPGAEFEIMAVMGYKAPETFGDEGDLKINLSLYSNYVMNFYIPTDLPISDVVISTTADGSKALVNRGNVTLEGSGEHVRFSYLFNTADAELKTFYIVYTVEGGNKIAYPVEYSVPAYAFAVMEQADAVEPDANKATLAKKLVVNMANYANEYIKACGSEANEYYAYIVDTYGAEYLTEYRGLTNDKFTAEGYTASAGAESLIEDISFYFGATPAFVIKVAEGYTVNVKYGNGAYVAATLGEDGYFYSYAGRDDAEQRSLSLSKMTDTITFQITDGDAEVGTVEYSLEAYINNLIENSQENFINAAKALYAFANAAAAYKAA